MKFIIPFLFAALSAGAQHALPEVKDNIIFIKATGSEEEIYTATGKALVASGFVIQNSNKEFMQLATAPKQCKDYTFNYSLNITISGDRIKVIPTVHSGRG